MAYTHRAVMGDEVYADRIAGGCDLYIYPLKMARQTHVLLTVDFGSVDMSYKPPSGEEFRPAPAGAAHFLEHLLFDKESGDISERFNDLGSEVDAQTSFTSTEFAVTFNDSFHSNVALLLETALVSHFTDEGVRRERDIIRREINLYAEEVEWACFSAAMDALYRGQPVGKDVAGSVDSLLEIDRSVLEGCHHTFYHPERMSMYICGDVGAEETAAETSRLWETYTRFDCVPATEQRLLPVPLPERHEKLMSVAIPRLCLAFHDPVSGLYGEELLKREHCLEMGLDILFGPASEFHSRCYESGLIEAGSFDFDLFSDPKFGFCHLTGETVRPDELEEATLRELAKVRDGDAIVADFERAKYKAFGELMRSYDDVEDCAGMTYDEVFSGAPPFSYFRTLEQIRPEDIREVLASVFDGTSHGRALVLPLES